MLQLQQMRMILLKNSLMAMILLLVSEGFLYQVDKGNVLL